MATTELALEDPELLETAWDLDPLVEARGEDGAVAALDDAERRAEAFASRYAGRVAQLTGAELVEAMREVEAIEDVAGKAGTYASLRFSTDTSDPARGALLQRVQERGTAIETNLLFFGLEWAALDDAKADELLAADGLDFARHFLRMERRYRPYLLSEPEEKILTEKQVSARAAWARLFSEQVSAVEVGAKGEALDVALARLSSNDRSVREQTARDVTEALKPGLRTRGFIFNTLLADKATDDRLRGYESWISSRNLSNQVSDESVDALVHAVQDRYEAIPQRWYRLKAQMLGLPKLADFDRAAAVTGEEPVFRWGEARDLVLDAFGSFSPDLEREARRFFDERWIDAPVRTGKRGGAFATTAVPSVHPYVMLNFTAKRRDVLTLAHELGHGLHFALAAPQGILQQHTPLTVAETASVFGEAIVFGRLLDQAETPESRLGLLAEAIEGAIATVFRQTAMNRFEDAVHTSRRSEGELSVERIGELWADSQHALFGDAVEVTEGYRTWWSYIPHFINTPGYVYAYAYGQLLAMSVYRRYREEGESFVPRYLEMLSAGGSMLPEDLGRIVGIDLTDPGFWSSGLDLIQEQLDAAEAAAREAGRI
jgi:oligoendopeptidase F